MLVLCLWNHVFHLYTESKIIECNCSSSLLNWVVSDLLQSPLQNSFFPCQLFTWCCDLSLIWLLRSLQVMSLLSSHIMASACFRQSAMFTSSKIKQININMKQCASNLMNNALFWHFLEIFTLHLITYKGFDHINYLTSMSNHSCALDLQILAGKIYT